jgi:hypothetical protein
MPITNLPGRVIGTSCAGVEAESLAHDGASAGTDELALRYPQAAGGR